MFKIQDGRDCFFQWDLNRYLIVEDKSIKQVHYCNRTGDCSLVCPVFEQDGVLLAAVPNIILQNDWPVNVYGYDKEYTKHSYVFKIKARTKPEDYVYTEEEIRIWDDLDKRLIELEFNGVPEETIAQKIADYFVEHPVEAGATEAEAAQIEQNKKDIEELKNKQPDLTGYAKTEDIPDVSKFITRTQLDVETTQINSKFGDYYTSDHLDSMLSDYVTNGQLEDFVPDVDLSGYAKTEDIPDVSAFQTEEQVIALIAEHGGGGGSLPASEEGEF